jgi:hypothetical protein
MREEDPREAQPDENAAQNEARAWYAQIASISSSVMLVAVLLLGAVVAYVIADMRNELHAVSGKMRQEAPSLKEKDLLIKELREENGQLKVRLEQLQREVARASGASVPSPTSAAPEAKGAKLSEAGGNLAGCINAALNGKGSVEEKCKGQTGGALVVKSQG